MCQKGKEKQKLHHTTQELHRQGRSLKPSWARAKLVREATNNSTTALKELEQTEKSHYSGQIISKHVCNVPESIHLIPQQGLGTLLETTQLVPTFSFFW